MLRPVALTCLCFGLLAVPASAATVEDLKACYVSAGRAETARETITVRGSDFTQVSTVEVLFDGVLMGSVPTGSIGEFEFQLPAPFQRTGERPLVVTVRDGVNQIDKTTRITNLAMTVRPKRSSPGRRVRFRGRGFTQSAAVFAHYLFGGTEQRTVRFARHATGPCGTFSVKRRLIPVDNASTGRWILQVDQKRAFSAKPDPVWVRRPIDVVEVRP